MKQGEHIVFDMETDSTDPFDQEFVARSFNFELVIALRQLLREGDVVVDAGAQKGYISLHASLLVGNGGRGISVEPDPRSRNILLKNCLLNHIENIKIISVALGETSEDKLMKLSSQLGWSSFYPNDRNKHTMIDEQFVAVTRLDEILGFELPGRQLKKLAFIKIDCEGAEPEVIRGMEGIFSAASPLLWVEVNTGSLSAAKSSEEDLLIQLWRFGYRTFLPKVRQSRSGFPTLVLKQYYGSTKDTSHRVFDVFAAKDAHLVKIQLGGIQIDNC